MFTYVVPQNTRSRDCVCPRWKNMYCGVGLEGDEAQTTSGSRRAAAISTSNRNAYPVLHRVFAADNPRTRDFLPGSLRFLRWLLRVRLHAKVQPCQQRHLPPTRQHEVGCYCWMLSILTWTLSLLNTMSCFDCVGAAVAAVTEFCWKWWR